jgi:hypothetical protein
MTVGIAQPQPTPSADRVSNQSVDLAAAIRLLPNSGQVPDLTGGLGNAAYDFGQTFADGIIRAVVNGINLSALAQAAGVDPQSLLTGLLADLPANLLPGILASLSLDVPVLGPVLDTLTGGNLALLTTILNLLGVDEVTDGTLTGLLALLGLDLADPLNLSGLAVPGLNVVTSGPTFAVLKMLGLDLGWVPSLPNSVANEINGSDYLKLGVDGVLDVLLTKLQKSTLPGAALLIAPLVNLIASITDPLTSQLPDVIDVRVVPTVGIGLGAYAAAMAYEKVLAELASQPGGSAYVGTDPLLGSLTILPLVLINNPARPDGGAFARFGPLAALFGINTVNPRTEATSDGDGLGVPVLGTGITLGHANILPILVDATYEYQPLSDLASTPNPITLANNLAAALMPTYMLRGLSLDGLENQILGQVGDLVHESVLSGNPLALNIYLTLHSATLPMLEPLYLASDFLNLVGLSPLAAIPMKLANALAPALSTLTNIGYANVVQNADGTYTRDFTNAGTETPFMSFPDIDYGRVPGDVINQLIGGFTKEFFSNNPTPNTPNVLSNLLNALLNGGLGDLLGGLGGVNPLAAQQAPAALTAASVPATDGKLLSLSATDTEKTGTDAKETDEKTATATDSAKKSAAQQEPAATAEAATAAEKPATEEAPADETLPKHAKADEESQPATDEATQPKHAKPDEDTKPDTKPAADATEQTPKHAKPSLNVVRDSLNASTPNDAKPAEKTATVVGGKTDEATATEGAAESDGASTGAAA